MQHDVEANESPFLLLLNPYSAKMTLQHVSRTFLFMKEKWYLGKMLHNIGQNN